LLKLGIKHNELARLYEKQIVKTDSDIEKKMSYIYKKFRREKV